MTFWLLQEFLWLTQMKKKKNHYSDHFAKDVWFVIFMYHTNYCQLNYSLIYKMSKYYRNMFPNFLAFLSCNWETGQPNHDIGTRCSYWYQLHFTWLFVDVLLNFNISWPISKFTDFLRFSAVPDFFLTRGNPDGGWCFGAAHRQAISEPCY